VACAWGQGGRGRSLVVELLVAQAQHLSACRAWMMFLLEHRLQRGIQLLLRRPLHPGSVVGRWHAAAPRRTPRHTCSMYGSPYTMACSSSRRRSLAFRSVTRRPRAFSFSLLQTRQVRHGRSARSHPSMQGCKATAHIQRFAWPCGSIMRGQAPPARDDDAVLRAEVVRGQTLDLPVPTASEGSPRKLATENIVERGSLAPRCGQASRLRDSRGIECRRVPRTTGGGGDKRITSGFRGQIRSARSTPPSDALA